MEPPPDPDARAEDRIAFGTEQIQLTGLAHGGLSAYIDEAAETTARPALEAAADDQGLPEAEAIRTVHELSHDDAAVPGLEHLRCAGRRRWLPREPCAGLIPEDHLSSCRLSLYSLPGSRLRQAERRRDIAEKASNSVEGTFVGRAGAGRYVEFRNELASFGILSLWRPAYRARVCRAPEFVPPEVQDRLSLAHGPGPVTVTPPLLLVPGAAAHYTRSGLAARPSGRTRRRRTTADCLEGVEP